MIYDLRPLCRRRHAEARSAERERARGLALLPLSPIEEVVLRLGERARDVRRAGGEGLVAVARERRSARDDHEIGEVRAEQMQQVEAGIEVIRIRARYEHCFRLHL